MEISSLAFEHKGLIPTRYTCDGDDASPPLVFRGVPEEAESLVLIMEDPDVPPQLRPDRMWDHWIVFNIPPQTQEISEGHEPPGEHGRGTSGNLDYHGPCPPDREHRYVFKLFALDTMLGLPMGASKSEVEIAMEGHILVQTELMGRYVRS